MAAPLLADARLWGEDLAKLPGLADHLAKALAAIESQGVKDAMQALVVAA